MSELDWVMFSIGFVFIFMSLGILGLKPETVYTLKMKFGDTIEDVAWFPHKNPEDNVGALTIRMAEHFGVEVVNHHLLLNGEILESDITVVDALVHIQEYHSVNPMQNELDGATLTSSLLVRLFSFFCFQL